MSRDEEDDLADLLYTITYRKDVNAEGKYLAAAQVCDLLNIIEQSLQ